MTSKKTQTKSSELKPFTVSREADPAGLTEVGLQVRAAPLADAFRDRLPLLREYQEINQHFGAEIAQVVFTTVLERLPSYGPFIKRIRAHNLKSTQSASFKEMAAQYEVTIVASQLPLTGRAWGDHVEEWRTWARSLGFKTDVISTLPSNDIWQNAALISSHLLTHPHPNRILITLGQGAAEFRSLLTRRLGVRGGNVHRASGSGADHAGELDSVKLWLNVAGAYGGASVSRYWKRSFLSRSLLRIELAVHGRNANVVNQIDSRLSAFQAAPNFPREMKAINLVGTPYRHQVPTKLIATHSNLSRFSSNDGMVDLYSSIAHPGLIVPIPAMSQQVESLKLEPVLKRTLAVYIEDQLQAENSIQPQLDLPSDGRDLE